MTRSRNLYAKRLPWTATEDETLRGTWADHPCSAIAELLGRTTSSVDRRVRVLGLKKSPGFASAYGRLASAHPNAVAKRFKPGTTPPNKGLRRPGWAPGRMAESQFKPGALPHTHVAIGTEVIDSSGYLKRKIRDDAPLGMTRRNWEFVHKLMWVEHHGPVPPHHMVVFRNGDRKDIRIENLELISRQEHIRRHTLHRYPKEIVLAIQMKGVLTRVIDNRKKEAK